MAPNWNGIPVLSVAHKLGRIGIKHGGTFALKELPVMTMYSVENCALDRWLPDGDQAKDEISSLPQTKGDWQEAYGIWFGFEGEGMIFPEHIYEYYNLIVIRPKFTDLKRAVDMATMKMGLV